MNSCWSCLVVIEKGANVCPLCGADQTPLPPISPDEMAIVSGSNSAIVRWVVAAVAILCVLGVVAWQTTGATDDDESAQAEAAATSALVNVRVALSQYAMSHSDQYPATLDPLGAQAAMPVQDAQVDGYVVEYESLRSDDGKIRNFALLAKPEKANCRSFYIDQSGLLRATQENRPARVDDPPA